MKIIVTSGKGTGKTLLSAFDAALWDAGIANQNLIKLTSIIPAGSRVITEKPKNNKRYGQKLFCVIADKRISEIGREAWAGIGWVQAKDGKGLFVEHTGSKEEEVMRLIKQTILDMLRYRKEKFSKIHYVISGSRCELEPICALACAVYKLEGWN